MLTAGGVSYGYDNNGNLTSRGADSFAWDAEDRLTSATVGGTTATFAYNGDGLRDSRTQGSTLTFTWDVATSIPQVLDDGAFKYVYGIGRIAELGPGTTTHYYLPDVEQLLVETERWCSLVGKIFTEEIQWNPIWVGNRGRQAPIRWSRGLGRSAGVPSAGQSLASRVQS